MKITSLMLTLVLALSVTSGLLAQNQTDYTNYHQAIIRVENLIALEKYAEAFSSYERIFDSYEFVFLRDHKVATQLALFLGDEEAAFTLLKSGISNGWTLKGIKKNEFLKPLQGKKEWKSIKSEYQELRSDYNENLNQPLRAQVEVMYKKDQRKALVALFRVGQNSKNNYSEKRFAPQSEIQLTQLNEIMDEYGYPGEQLIGNNWWVSVILSHHNSISENYNSRDTLYSSIKPKLLDALNKGEVSPTTLATIEDWKIAALNEHKLTSFGLLGKIPNDSQQELVNDNRSSIGLRSIGLRNALIDIEEKTGLDLYLPKGWQKGKIMVDNTD